MGKKKLWYVYTMEYYTAVKKKKGGTLTFCDSMVIETIILSKISQAVRQIPYDLTYMLSLMNKIN